MKKHFIAMIAALAVLSLFACKTAQNSAPSATDAPVSGGTPEVSDDAAGDAPMDVQNEIYDLGGDTSDVDTTKPPQLAVSFGDGETSGSVVAVLSSYSYGAVEAMGEHPALIGDDLLPTIDVSDTEGSVVLNFAGDVSEYSVTRYTRGDTENGVEVTHDGDAIELLKDAEYAYDIFVTYAEGGEAHYAFGTR